MIVTNVPFSLFVSNTVFQSDFPALLRAQVQALGFSKVLQVIVSNVGLASRRTSMVSMDVRVDSNSSAQYLAPLQQALLASTQFSDSVLVALRQYNLTVFGPATLAVLRVYSLRETPGPQPVSVASSSSGGDDNSTALAIGIPIALIGAIVLVLAALIIYRRRRRTSSPSSAKKTVENYDQSILALELVRLRASIQKNAHM